jgi:hypothetical protein
MSISKMVAAAGGFMALLVSAGASRAAAAEPCKLGTEYTVTSVGPSLRPTETGGYGGTVNPLLRGADIKVAPQPGLTAQWMEERLAAQVAAGECNFGTDQVYVAVIPGSDHMLVRVTSMYEGPGVTRLSDRKPDQRAATEILRRARELPVR